MSTERDDILEAIREGRQAAEDLGLRRYRAFVRLRTWRSGVSTPWALSRPGDGFPCDAEVEIAPSPKVTDVDVRLVASSGGTFRAGDMRLAKITPKREPSTGLEITDIVRAVESPADEAHVVLVSRAGTRWHTYEGGARLLVSGPWSEATALTCVNALRTAIATHLADDEVHVAPDGSAVPGTPATDTPTAIALANALWTLWSAHRASTSYHPEVDPYALASATATNAQTLCVRLHELVRVFNAHVATGPVTEAVVVRAVSTKAFEHELIVRPTRRTP